MEDLYSKLNIAFTSLVLAWETAYSDVPAAMKRLYSAIAAIKPVDLEDGQTDVRVTEMTDEIWCTNPANVAYWARVTAQQRPIAAPVLQRWYGAMENLLLDTPELPEASLDDLQAAFDLLGGIYTELDNALHTSRSGMAPLPAMTPEESGSPAPDALACYQTAGWID